MGIREPMHCLVLSNKELKRKIGREGGGARREEREGGGGRDLALKNMGVLMPAEKFGCWRQNLNVVAQRTQAPL